MAGSGLLLEAGLLVVRAHVGVRGGSLRGGSGVKFQVVRVRLLGDERVPDWGRMRFQHQGQRPAERQRQNPACERHAEMLQSVHVALPVHHPHLAARPGLEVRCIQNFSSAARAHFCCLGMDVTLIVALMIW